MEHSQIKNKYVLIKNRIAEYEVSVYKFELRISIVSLRGNA